MVNGERRELDQGLTIQLLVESLDGSPASRGVAVALDGEVVPRGAWERTLINEGARVEVVAAVQGG